MEALLQEIGGWAGAGNIVGVGLVVLFLLLGKLRPEKQFIELREDRDSRVAEAVSLVDVWKQAVAVEAGTREQLEKQLQTMVDEKDQTAKIIHDLLQVVQALRAERGPDA